MDAASNDSLSALSALVAWLVGGGGIAVLSKAASTFTAAWRDEKNDERIAREKERAIEVTEKREAREAAIAERREERAARERELEHARGERGEDRAERRQSIESQTRLCEAVEKHLERVEVLVTEVRELHADGLNGGRP